MKLKASLVNSINGLITAWSDRSFQIEIFAGLLLIAVIFFSVGSLAEKLAIIATYIVLLVVELINTALERLCDRVTMEHDTAIKEVKDMGSAAVFLVLLLLAGQVIGLIL